MAEILKQNDDNPQEPSAPRLDAEAPASEAGVEKIDCEIEEARIEAQYKQRMADVAKVVENIFGPEGGSESDQGKDKDAPKPKPGMKEWNQILSTAQKKRTETLNEREQLALLLEQKVRQIRMEDTEARIALLEIKGRQEHEEKLRMIEKL